MAARNARAQLDLVVFGYASPDDGPGARARVSEFALLIGEAAGIDIRIAPFPSYERVAQLLHKKDLDVAWLGPIPYIALERKGTAIALARQHLAGRAHYHSAIIVNAQSGIRSLARLKGLRAAWVDRHSASGFVMPRIQLAALGVDPRTAFSEQRFYGSHEGVVRAVAEGLADFGGTYVRLDQNGAIVHGPWSQMPRYVRHIKTLSKFGEIPSDVIVARADLDPDIARRLQASLLGVAKDPRGRTLIRQTFGADDFRKPDPTAYETLRALTADAAAEGLLDAEEAIDDEEIEEVDMLSDALTTEIPVARLDETMEAEIVEVVEPQRPRSRSGRRRPR